MKKKKANKLQNANCVYVYIWLGPVLSPAPNRVFAMTGTLYTYPVHGSQRLLITSNMASVTECNLNLLAAVHMHAPQCACRGQRAALGVTSSTLQGACSTVPHTPHWLAHEDLSFWPPSPCQECRDYRCWPVHPAVCVISRDVTQHVGWALDSELSSWPLLIFN